MKTKINLSLIMALLLALPVFCQDDQHSSEIDSSVPELFKYHEVIYPIWHTAYPEKNFTKNS